MLPAEDQITHEISLDSELDRQLGRDIFKDDPEYEQHEQEYEVWPYNTSISCCCDVIGRNDRSGTFQLSPLHSYVVLS